MRTSYSIFGGMAVSVFILFFPLALHSISVFALLSFFLPFCSILPFKLHETNFKQSKEISWSSDFTHTHTHIVQHRTTEAFLTIATHAEANCLHRKDRYQQLCAFSLYLQPGCHNLFVLRWVLVCFRLYRVSTSAEGFFFRKHGKMGQI